MTDTATTTATTLPIRYFQGLWATNIMMKAVAITRKAEEKFTLISNKANTKTKKDTTAQLQC